MSAGERNAADILILRDAFLLERYRAGEGELQPETLRSPLARTLGEAMLSANGQGRDAALEAALAALPRATSDGVKRALFAADIEGEEPTDPRDRHVLRGHTHDHALVREPLHEQADDIPV